MASSSFDPQFLNIPIRALNINGASYPIITREATITRGINKHDTIEMSVLLSGTVTFNGKVRIPIDADFPSSGTQDVDIQTLDRQPVSFVYGVSPRTEQFIGYVTAVTPEEKFKEGVNFKVQLTGASVVLQRVIRRFDRLITVPQAISQRVEAQWLGLLCDPHTHVWSSIAQTNETDWQMVVALANALGYIVLTWGAVVRVVDPLQLFLQFPYTTLVSADDLLEADRKLMDFKPTEVSSDLLDSMGVEVFYFDPTGAVSSIKQTLTSSRPAWQPFTGRPVESRAEAEVIIKASESSVRRWTQTATARIQGDAALYPGLIVSIVPGATNSAFVGRWLVLQVTHSMNRQAFQTELVLARPKMIPNYSNTAFQHFWDRAGIGKPTVFQREEQWFSSISNPSARAIA